MVWSHPRVTVRRDITVQGALSVPRRSYVQSVTTVLQDLVYQSPVQVGQ